MGRSERAKSVFRQTATDTIRDYIGELDRRVIENEVVKLAEAHRETVREYKRTCPCTDCAKWRLYEDNPNER